MTSPFSACGAVLSAVRSCHIAPYVWHDTDGIHFVQGHYYFVPPGQERWTIGHHTLDPPAYWANGPVPFAGNHTLKGGWFRGTPPDPYPGGCVAHPEVFPSGVWTGYPDLGDPFGCFPGCLCGTISPTPPALYVDLRRWGGGLFPSCNVAPAVYRLPRSPFDSCEYRFGGAHFTLLKVGLAVGPLGRITVGANLSGFGEGNGQRYQSDIPLSQVWQGGLLAKVTTVGTQCLGAPATVRISAQPPPD